MENFDLRKYLAENRLVKEEGKTSISSAEFERIKNSPEIEKLAAAVAKDPKAVANIEKVIQKSGALNEMAGDIEANDISKIAQAIDTLNEEEEVGGGAPILIGLMGTATALLTTDALEMVNNLLNLPAASVIGGVAAMAAGAVLGAVYSKIKGLKENINEEDYSIKLLVPKVYFNVEDGELSGNKYEWYTEDELEDGADQTSYTDGAELDDVVLSNDYDQALDFAKRYPNLIKITK